MRFGILSENLLKTLGNRPGRAWQGCPASRAAAGSCHLQQRLLALRARSYPGGWGGTGPRNVMALF